jgi:putative mRNA 3-end processing factor
VVIAPLAGAVGRFEALAAYVLCYPEHKASLPALVGFRGWLHGAVQALTGAYRDQGVALAPCRPLAELARGESLAGRLVLAPPSARRSPWMKRFRQPQTAFASGWMAVRGARRRRGDQRGFVLSDHADWQGLIDTVRQSGARLVYLTHGQGELLARYLREQEGIAAEALITETQISETQNPEDLSPEAISSEFSSGEELER